MSVKTQRTSLVRYPIYTIGDVAGGCYAVLPSFLLMFYMTNVMGISVAFATFVVLVPKLVDLATAPIVGTLSDRTRTRFGRRRPWMLAASLAIAATFPFIWIAPFSNPVQSGYFILVMFTACTVAITCFVVPFLALNSEVAQTYRDRTTLNAYRTTYSCIGMMLAGAVAPLLVGLGGGGRHGYALMGIVVGVLMCVVTFTTFATAREPERATTQRMPTARESLLAIRSNPSFMFLLAAFFLYIAGVGLQGSVLVYFITYVLERGPEMLSLIFFVSTGCSLLAIPAWTGLSKRLGKLPTLLLCFVPSLAAAVGFYLVTKGSPIWAIGMLAALSGLSAGGIQIFFFSMLADSIRHGGARIADVDSAALLTGIFVSGEKLGFAVGALLAGVLFDLAGLVTTTAGSVAQPASAILGIRLGIAFIPVAFYALCAGVLFASRRFEREVRAASLSHDLPSPA